MSFGEDIPLLTWRRLIGARVSAIMERELNMVMTKLKAWVVAVLMLAIVGGGTGRWSPLAAAEEARDTHKEGSAKHDDPGENPCRTPNFLVEEAPTAMVARRIGQAAERLRTEQALLWLDKELPAWQKPCSIHIQLNGAGDGGSSTFTFDKGKLIGQKMTLTGSLEDILACVLPHEMTHVILANRFGHPVPRWADEGAAMLAEGERTKRRYDFHLRRALAGGIALRKLFTLQDYPADLTVFYSQGYSITRFLVESGDRRKFLALIDQGLRDGWDLAVQTHYGFRDVEELEKAWLIRNSKVTEKKYTIDIAIKDRTKDGSWKTLCRSSLAAQEGKQVRFFSGGRVACPRASESYPVGFSVALTAIQTGEAKASFEATVEKTDAFDLEDGEFEFQKVSLVTVAEVNLGDLHRITFAKDDNGKDITIVELKVNEVKK